MWCWVMVDAVFQGSGMLDIGIDTCLPMARRICPLVKYHLRYFPVNSNSLKGLREEEI